MGKEDTVNSTLARYDFSSPVFKSIYDYEIFAKGKEPDLYQQSVQYKSDYLNQLPKPHQIQAIDTAQSLSDPYVKYYEKALIQNVQELEKLQQEQAHIKSDQTISSKPISHYNIVATKEQQISPMQPTDPMKEDYKQFETKTFKEEIKYN